MSMDLTEATILAVEETRSSIRVVFETPGDQFNQSYPKRLSHNFPKEPYYLDRDDSGETRIVHHVKKTYLGYEFNRDGFVAEDQCTAVSDRLKTVRDDLEGTVIQ